ncbi:hypothetical protein A2U01_0098985, partial [Trifolium medium]|nr:hypothetical protein [Trifolium medium]
MFRAGTLSRDTEQNNWFVVPSRSGFGPARGPVQNNPHDLLTVK